MGTEHLIITGRSGTGVTTIAVNLSAALAEAGHRVAHVGHDPRRVGTARLRGENLLVACADDCTGVRPACALGFRDILCIECGTTEEETQTDFRRLCRLQTITRFAPDYVVHDLSGEPGTVLPYLAKGLAPWRLIIVTSGDVAAIGTLNAFIASIAPSHNESGRFGGVIANNLAGPFFESLVADYISESGARLLGNVPRSLLVSVSEYYGKSLIEAAPESHNSFSYRKLARVVTQELESAVPRSLDEDTFAEWLRKWGEIINELETGLIRDGAAI